MSDFRVISRGDDDEVVRGLRSLYAAPAADAYWNELESRIMSRVADVELGWWTEFDRWLRPALAAAAVLLLAAGAAILHTRRLEADLAVDTMLSSPPIPISTSFRPSLDNDRDTRIRYLFGCSSQEPACSAQNRRR